jgi:hypothetical protein
MSFQAESERPHSRHIIVTLIHGTYGRGFFPGKRWGIWPLQKPIWSESGSSFQTILSYELEVKGFIYELRTFNWPGDNSVKVRDIAAQKLARELDSQARADPKAKQVVIAHSHGGNIALTAALHHRKTQNELFIITLATPFLDFVKVSSEVFDKNRGYRTLNLRLFSWLFAYFLSWLLGTIVLPALGLQELLHGTSFIPWFVLIGIGSVVSILWDQMCLYFDLALQRSLQHVDSPASAHTAVRLLVLRGPDDEAALLLVAGSIQFLLASRVYRVALFLSIVLPSSYLAGIWIMPNIFSVEDPVEFLLNKLFLRLAVVVLAFLALAAVGRFVFGREFLLGGTEYEVNSNSAPDFVGDITIATLHGRSGIVATGYRIYGKPAYAWELDVVKRPTYRLRHSLYEHENCVKSIVAWLDQRC